MDTVQKSIKKNFWKMLFLILLVMLIFFIGYQKFQNYSAINYSNQPLAQAPSASTTIFAFDLNQVLVMADFSKIKSILLCEVPKWQILLFVLNPLHWFNIIKSGMNKRRLEFILEDLIRIYPNLTPLNLLYQKLFEAEHLNNELIAIVTELKQAGYLCYILSNIGPDALEGIMKKFPVLRSLFDGFYLATSVDDMSKPDDIFYERFKKYLVEQGHRNKQIIFIDNNASNIIGANKNGIKGMLFTSSADLEKRLIKFGIL